MFSWSSGLREELFGFSKWRGRSRTLKAPRISNPNISPRPCNTTRSTAICGCVMNRREFFLTWIVQSQSTSIEVEVIEVFPASDGPSVFLVHHASEAVRTVFGEWLRGHDGARITCRLRNGTAVDGRIFRLKMCFGRGLILTRAAIAIRAKVL